MNLLKRLLFGSPSKKHLKLAKTISEGLIEGLNQSKTQSKDERRKG